MMHGKFKIYLFGGGGGGGLWGAKEKGGRLGAGVPLCTDEYTHI